LVGDPIAAPLTLAQAQASHPPHLILTQRDCSISPREDGCRVGPFVKPLEPMVEPPARAGCGQLRSRAGVMGCRAGGGSPLLRSF
jgi:hypothetical protein